MALSGKFSIRLFRPSTVVLKERWAWADGLQNKAVSPPRVVMLRQVVGLEWTWLVRLSREATLLRSKLKGLTRRCTNPILAKATPEERKN